MSDNDMQAVFTPQTKYDKDAIIEKAIESEIDDVVFVPNTQHLHHHLYEESGKCHIHVLFFFGIS